MHGLAPPRPLAPQENQIEMARTSTSAAGAAVPQEDEAREASETKTAHHGSTTQGGRLPNAIG